MQGAIINSPFLLNAQAPLDARSKVATLEERNSMQFPYVSLVTYVDSEAKSFIYTITGWQEYDVLTYIQALRDRCTQIEQLIAQLQQQSPAEFQAQLTALESAVSLLRTSITSNRSELELQISAVQTGVDNLNVNQRFESTNAAISSINSSIESIQSQITALNAFKQSAQANLDSIQAIQTELASTIESINSEIQSLSTRVDSIDGVTQQQVEQMIADASLQDVIDQVSQDLQSLSTSYGARLTALEAIAQTIAPISEDVAQLKAKTENLPQDLPSRLQALEALLDETYVTESEFNEFKASIQQSVIAVNSRVQTLEDKEAQDISEVNANVTALGARVTTIEQDIEHEGYERQEEDRVLNERISAVNNALSQRMDSLDVITQFDKPMNLPLVRQIQWTKVTRSGAKSPAGSGIMKLVLEEGYSAELTFEYAWHDDVNHKQPQRALFAENEVTLAASDVYTRIQDFQALQSMKLQMLAPKSGLELVNNKLVEATGNDIAELEFNFEHKKAVLIGSSSATSLSAADILNAYDTYQQFLVDSISEVSAFVTTQNSQYLFIVYPKTLGQISQIIAGADNVFNDSSWERSEVTAVNKAGLTQAYYVYRNKVLGAFTNAKITLE
jgi:predicted  nucleic acid-binding Zn-ribbon protein